MLNRLRPFVLLQGEIQAIYFEFRCRKLIKFCCKIKNEFSLSLKHEIWFSMCFTSFNNVVCNRLSFIINLSWLTNYYEYVNLDLRRFLITFLRPIMKVIQNPLSLWDLRRNMIHKECFQLAIVTIVTKYFSVAIKQCRGLFYVETLFYY